MVLNHSKAIPIDLGVIQGRCYGGRFRDFNPDERRLVGIKMAAEIDHPHDISIPTEDFSIPDEDDMIGGLFSALENVNDGNDLYVGCMGGIGRTGLFMGCLAKVMIEFHGGEYKGYTDPVSLVRGIYKGHAIETDEQQRFVRDFDTGALVSWLHALQDCSEGEARAQSEQAEFETSLDNPFAPIFSWWKQVWDTMTGWARPRS